MLGNWRNRLPMFEEHRYLFCQVMMGCPRAVQLDVPLVGDSQKNIRDFVKVRGSYHCCLWHRTLIRLVSKHCVICYFCILCSGPIFRNLLSRVDLFRTEANKLRVPCIVACGVGMASSAASLAIGASGIAGHNYPIFR